MNNIEQQPKIRTKNWVEINNDTQDTFNLNQKIKVKTAMLKPSLK